MDFNLKIDITPKFQATEIVHEIVEKTWFRFQVLAVELGSHILTYLQTYINAHTRRDGATGNLANAMTLDIDSTAGQAQVSWGIGHIPTLNSKVPYWRLINFGGLTWAAKTGRGVPGFFGTGNAPDPTKRGTAVGTERFVYDTSDKHSMMFPKSPIKPMNYVEATRMQLDNELQKILTYLTAHQ